MIATAATRTPSSAQCRRDGEPDSRHASATIRVTAAEPSAVTALATSVSQSARSSSTIRNASVSPAVGPGSPETMLSVAEEDEQRHRQGGHQGRELEPEAPRRQPPGDEAQLRLDPPRDDDDRPGEPVSLHPRDQPAAVVGLAQEAHRHHGADDHGDGDPEDQRRAARDLGRLVEALGEEVAEQRERCRPQPGAEDAVGDERPVAHPRAAGDERRQRANEADEATDQDRLAAVALEVGLDLSEALAGDPHPGAVAKHEVPSQPGADQEADACHPPRRRTRRSRS